MKISEFFLFTSSFFKVKKLFFGCLLVFALLLFRDVFSERTLVPNLEPYPDTFHYIIPARNLAKFGKFELSRGYGQIVLGVPPLYSLYLTPFYWLNDDPRFFYFANVVLSLVSISLFYLILKKLTKSIALIGLGLFLFVTNFYLYWYPQWAMAENLALPLFLLAVLLLVSKPTSKRALTAGVVVNLFYGVKYALIPVSSVLFVLFLTKYSFKIFSKSTGFKSKNLFYFLFTSVLVMFFVVFLNAKLTGVNLFQVLFDFLLPLLGFFKPDSVVDSGGGAWLSVSYFPKNLTAYLRAVFGSPTRFLWDSTPMFPKWLSFIGVAGIFLGLLNKKRLFISISLLFLGLSQIVFISFFYSVDLRYVYHLIPTLLLGIILFFDFVHEFFRARNSSTIFTIILLTVSGFYLYSNALRIKNQIVLNIKYAETPWYYISVLKLNNFFNSVSSQPRPVVISPMPPFYIDFYSNKKYDLLPLSALQEFRNERQQIWGPNDYSDLLKLYTKYLDDGRRLYVSTYGLGNEDYLHQDFEKIQENFKLKLIYDECYSQCKLYSIHNK